MISPKILLFLMFSLSLQGWSMDQDLPHFDFGSKLQHQPTPEERSRIPLRLFEDQDPSSNEIQKPSHDLSSFRHVLFSAETQGVSEAAYLRKAIAQNLPENVYLVVLSSAQAADQVRRQYEQWVPAHRLIIAAARDPRNGFWARDAFPVPVDMKSGKSGLVAAKYYRDFISGPDIAKSLAAENYFPKSFTFVGGNLLADEEGNCFVIDSYRLFGTSPNEIKNAYGCQSMTVLPHKAGIGDVDEVIKPLPGRRILSNIPEYKTLLESLGYSVIPLPKASGRYRTYANSLVVNGTVFMPTYGDSIDAQATQVYESLGMKVVPLPSNTLSDSYHGSIHCQTMAYPEIEIQELLRSL